MKVADVRRNLVPDTWTADGEGALPELGPILASTLHHYENCVFSISLQLLALSYTHFFFFWSSIYGSDQY